MIAHTHHGTCRETLRSALNNLIQKHGVENVLDMITCLCYEQDSLNDSDRFNQLIWQLEQSVDLAKSTPDWTH
jgi:hypothetical protein